MSGCYRMHAQCVREVVMNSSTPPVFSTFGSMGLMASLATVPPSAGWQLASALIAAIMTNILALGCLGSSNLLVFLYQDNLSYVLHGVQTHGSGLEEAIL